MTTSKKVCCEPGCDKRTQGVRCFEHKYVHKKSHLSKKELQRNGDLKRKYNLTLEDVDSLLIIFHGKCGICKSKLTAPQPTMGQKLSIMVIDHNHKTGNVRGLLCSACNTGIGLLKEDPEILKRAVEWCQ